MAHIDDLHLIAAVQADNIPAAVAALNAGANVNYSDASSGSCLENAAISGFIDMIQLLCGWPGTPGISVTITSVATGTGVYNYTSANSNITGANNAFANKFFTISGFATNNANNIQQTRCTASTATTMTFTNASSVSETTTVGTAWDVTVGNSIQVNLTDALRNKSALMGAAFASGVTPSCVECANILINMPGIDLNHFGFNGFTAINDAAFAGGTPVVRMLLAAGADPNIANVDGNTTLQSAQRAYALCWGGLSGTCPVTSGSSNNTQQGYAELILYLQAATASFLQSNNYPAGIATSVLSGVTAYDSGTILGTVPPGQPGLKLIDGTQQSATTLHASTNPDGNFVDFYAQPNYYGNAAGYSQLGE